MDEELDFNIKKLKQIYFMVFIVYHKMSRKLSASYILITENFIRDNEPFESYPLIKEYDKQTAIDYLSEIRNLPVESYLQFGEASFGMISYGYYKAQNNQIYILRAFCNGLQLYCKVDSEWEKYINEIID